MMSRYINVDSMIEISTASLLISGFVVKVDTERPLGAVFRQEVRGGQLFCLKGGGVINPPNEDQVMDNGQKKYLEEPLKRSNV